MVLLSEVFALWACVAVSVGSLWQRVGLIFKVETCSWTEPFLLPTGGVKKRRVIKTF